MSEEILKAIQTRVSKECQKKLKMYSISKEISLGETVRNILEKFTSTNKKIDTLIEDMN